MTNQVAEQSIAITLVKSLSGRKKSHQACAKGLGLRRIRHRVLVKVTPENMGMVDTIRYLLAVEENVA